MYLSNTKNAFSSFKQLTLLKFKFVGFDFNMNMRLPNTLTWRVKQTK